MATAVATAEPKPRRSTLRLPERLPDLRGKWLTAYTALWVLVMATSLIATARGTYISAKSPTMWTPYGFATSERPEGLRVESVTSPLAAARGVRAGEYVVAVDGWPLPRIAARAAARTHVVKPDGTVTSFTFRTTSGKVHTIRLVRSIANEQQLYARARVSRIVARASNLVGTLLLPALFIPAAILLFLRRRREAVPALLSMSFLMFAGIVNGPDMLGVSISIITAVATIATILLYAALFAFPSGAFEPRWTAVPFLLLPLLALFDNESAVGQLLGAIFPLLSVSALVSRYRKVGPGAERLQLRWAFLGLVAGIVLTFLSLAGTAAMLRWQAADPRWVAWQYVFVQPLGTWGLGIMALGLIVSIMRYRLYDADAVIGRSAAYAVLTLGFVALFAAIEKVIELLGQEYLGQNIGALAGGVAAALAAVAIAPMHDRTRRWAERRFQKGLYRLRHGLPPLVGDLRETAGLEQVAGATLDSLVDGVRARSAAIVVGEEVVGARDASPEQVKQWWERWSPPPRDGLDCDASDWQFPLRVPLEAEGHGRVGWLLLGARPDGTLFSKSELAVIADIAEPVARAVQVALRRQEREAQIDQRLGAIETAISKLMKRPQRSAAGSA
jgi:hypothetical protein